ncbi:hypothetical protein C8J57DRAFT_1511833 [Mycena rebaudengoi]|nr:hypothetical protein C8J57DRAFT_1511833 [Mycena rebaudengoi]
MNEDVPMLGAVVSYSRTRADGEDSGTQAKSKRFQALVESNMMSDARLLREELTAARRLRKEAEEEISHRDKLWTAHLQTFEKEAATAHHQEIAGVEGGNGTSGRADAGYAGRTGCPSGGPAEHSRYASRLAGGAAEGGSACYAATDPQVSHEKAMASKTNEIAAIMERVRPSRPLAPPAATELSSRSSSRWSDVPHTRIPTLQLQLPAPVPSTQLPDDIPMLGPVSESMIEGLVKKILTTMMIGEGRRQAKEE